MRQLIAGRPDCAAATIFTGIPWTKTVLTTMLVASVRNWFALGLTASMYRSVPNMNRGSIVSSFATGGIESAVIQAKVAAGKSVGPRR